jgi:hypothetical protein
MYGHCPRSPPTETSPQLTVVTERAPAPPVTPPRPRERVIERLEAAAMSLLMALTR